MIQAHMETRGFKSLAANMRGGREVILGQLNRTLRDISMFMVPALKSNTPRSGTGRSRGQSLANSTRGQVLGTREDQRLELRQGARTKAGVFYGHFVRGGTRPHVIRPYRAKALRFEVGGRVVFAQQVNHPGTKPNPYHVRTLDQQAGQIQTAVNQAGIDIVARLMNVKGLD